MRYILPFPLMIAALLTSVIVLAADGTFELSLKGSPIHIIEVEHPSQPAREAHHQESRLKLRPNSRATTSRRKR
jgi:hypothetical protein